MHTLEEKWLTGDLRSEIRVLAGRDLHRITLELDDSRQPVTGDPPWLPPRVWRQGRLVAEIARTVDERGFAQGGHYTGRVYAEGPGIPPGGELFLAIGLWWFGRGLASLRARR